MAKLLLIVCLVHFVAVALTSCSASRPLLAVAALPSDRTDSVTTLSRSAPVTADVVVVLADSTTPSTKTESDTGHAEALTESDSEEFVDDFGPCEEAKHEDEKSTGRPCHRMLPDYDPPASNDDSKTVP